MKRRRRDGEYLGWAIAKFELGDWEVEYHIAIFSSPSQWRTLCGVETNLPTRPTITRHSRLLITSCVRCHALTQHDQVDIPVARFGSLNLSNIESALHHPDPRRRRDMAKSLYHSRMQIYEDPGIMLRAAESLLFFLARRARETRGTDDPTP